MDPPPPHHLRQISDDPEAGDDGDDIDDVHYSNQPGAPAHYHPSPIPPYPFPPETTTPPPPPPATVTTTPPPSRRHSKRRSPTPPPPQPPQPQPPSPPAPSPPPPPPVVVVTPPPPPPPKPTPPPPQPPSPPPPPPPQKPNYDSDSDADSTQRRRISAVIFTILLIIALTALILWLIYKPHKPKFTATSTAIFSLNVTTTPPSYVTIAMQVTVLTRNPNKRTSLYYDRLTAAMHYNNHPITPPTNLPPLHHRKRSVVMISPVLGGAPVVVPPELAAGMVADQKYGVVGFSWVLTGRVKYHAGWFKSTDHTRVYVRCDVIVGLKSGVNNPSGQVPLLGNPPCVVDI